ncbi:MAG: hypothetical protein RLY78_3525 [Pseudomonadota bacterium]
MPWHRPPRRIVAGPGSAAPSGSPAGGARATGRPRRLIPGLAALLCGLAGMAAVAQPAAPAPTLVELQQRARTLGVHTQRRWLDLLHVQPLAGIGPARSLADDPGFFLAPGGARDPEAELQATLAAFFDPAERHAAGQTAQCRFPARKTFLLDVLGLTADALPAQPCPRYDDWRAGIRAERLTLVYAAAYINSPASMFGHTLLRLDPPEEPAQSPLLSYSISYAVSDAADTADPLFELKGLFGLYPGAFTNAPYYLRVRAYTHMEDRDIWEYALDLSPVERERLLAHTWELGFTRFDYWFFDENCAYHLLSLLDVARPGLALTDRFRLAAIPSDTVKAVASVPGLVRQRVYRPSAGSQLAARAAQVDASALSLAGALAERPLPERGPIARPARPMSTGPQSATAADAAPGAPTATPAATSAATPADDPLAARLAALAPPQRAQVLDLAERQVSLLAARGRWSSEEAQARRMALLLQRAALPLLPEIAVPPADNAPERGHGTARIEALATRHDGRGALLLQLHPAYHELLDPEPGFAPGAQIRFFDTRLRADDRGLHLDALRPVDILSVAPPPVLGPALAWKVNAGWQRAPGAAPAQAGLDAVLNGGPGLSRVPWSGGGHGTPLAYALMDNQLQRVAGDPADASRWRLGSGVHLGLVTPLGAHWRAHLQWRARAYLGDAPQEREWNLRLRRTLGHDTAGLLECGASRRGTGRAPTRCALGLQHHW